jgi:hypothetical protein
MLEFGSGPVTGSDVYERPDPHLHRSSTEALQIRKNLLLTLGSDREDRCWSLGSQVSDTRAAAPEPSRLAARSFGRKTK